MGINLSFVAQQEHQATKQHNSPTTSKTGENKKGSNEKSKKKTNQPNTSIKSIIHFHKFY